AERCPLFHNTGTLAAPEGFWTIFTENMLHNPGSGLGIVLLYPAALKPGWTEQPTYQHQYFRLALPG
ncbi:MAG: hypothetical protein IBX69_18470, partial [Anaerolineales bacterium]|nr:hypothetical protein [Anaerolineales bacterium]